MQYKRGLIALWAFSAVCGTTQGAVTFSENFDDQLAASRWTTASTGDASASMAFDYVGAGIALAPGGGSGFGARFVANDVDAAGTDPTEAVFARPDSISSPGSVYTITADVWVNYSGATSTTEFAYMGVNNANGTVQRPTGGTTGTNPAGALPGVSPTNSGLTFGWTGDGGAARDYRAFNNGTEDVADTNFTAKHVLTSGNFGTPAQDSLNPYYNTVFTAAGTGQTVGEAGNQWVRVAMVQHTDHTEWWMNGKLIYSVNSVAAFDKPLIGYGDPFASVSPGGAATFAIFDNVQVTDAVPEPGTIAVISIGAVALASRRRRA